MRGVLFLLLLCLNVKAFGQRLLIEEATLPAPGTLSFHAGKGFLLAGNGALYRLPQTGKPVKAAQLALGGILTAAGSYDSVLYTATMAPLRLMAWDVSSLTEPRKIAEVSLEALGRPVQRIEAGYQDIFLAAGAAGLLRYDVRNPHRPLPLEGAGFAKEVTAVRKEGQWLYVSGYDGFRIYHLTPKAMEERAYLPGAFTDMEVRQGRVWLSNYPSLYRPLRAGGIVVLDARRPESLQALKEIKLSGQDYIRDLSLGCGAMAAAAESGDMFYYRLEDDTVLTPRDTIFSSEGQVLRMELRGADVFALYPSLGIVQYRNPESYACAPCDTLPKDHCFPANEVVPETLELPEDALFPNPVVESAVFAHDLKRDTYVYLSLYDSRGRLMQTVFEGFLTKGYHRWPIAMGGYGNGLYVLRYDDAKGKRLRVKVVKAGMP